MQYTKEGDTRKYLGTWIARDDSGRVMWQYGEVGAVPLARYELLREGLEVFDPDGYRIGNIRDVYWPSGGLGPGRVDQELGGHIRVFRDLAGSREDLLVPFEAIRDVKLDRVVLNVHREYLDEQGWNRDGGPS